MINDQILIRGIIQTSLLFLIAYSAGSLVFYKGVKVNYTRKINHFSLFFIPMFLDKIIPIEPSLELIIIGSVFAVFSLMIYLEAIRLKSKFIQRMFLSFDRPEDRPNTLLWLSTQTAFGYLVIIPFLILFYTSGYEYLIIIPILVNGIGDGLAEPVGVRFGKHKYQTYALFSKVKYERTLEGSACVFITSVVVILFFQSGFTSSEFIYVIIIFPIVMTLSEAFAPHTWDTPFLFLFGYSTIYLIKIIPFITH